MTDFATRRPKLIVNGDDFGISHAVNQGIVRAYRDGILTSCSLMAAGEFFEEAVSLARANEGLAVGLHLVTVMGKSVLPHSQVPTLVNREGNFRLDPTLAGLRYFFSRKARRELRMELRAQFEKFAATGLPISHVDSHLHMHIHPVILEQAINLAEEYGVRYIRVPEDDFLLAMQFGVRISPAMAVQAPIFKLLCRRMRRKLEERGFTTPRRVYGHFLSGKLSEHYVSLVLNRLEDGLYEIYLHPACYEGEPKSLNPDDQRLLNEFRILLSSKLRQTIETLNIHLMAPPSPGGPNKP